MSKKPKKPTPLPPWVGARFDRIFEDLTGRRYILDGTASHGGNGSIHPGARNGCPLCASPDHRHNCFDHTPYRFPQ